MIDRLIEALQEAGLLLKDKEIQALSEAHSLLLDEDIADALWLVAHMGDEPSVDGGRDGSETTPETTSKLAVEEVESEVVEGDAALPSPVVSAYVQDSQTQSGAADTPESGLPLQVQAAPALPNARLMGRSLRPLMRKVPSRTQMVLDTAATVDRIAQEDIWIPLLKPASERWFDLELVIESSPLSFVWESTLTEFQRLLELQGAFRNVRAWSVETVSSVPQLRPKTQTKRPVLGQPSLTASSEAKGGRLPRELIDASGRTLVLYVSDCRSPLWQQGKIHDWLQLWSQHGPTTVVQLLPERMWSQTALNAGFKVQVSAFSPGVPNPKLQVYNAPSRRPIDDSQAVTLPVMTLTAKALQQWARVVAAGGQQRLPARLFDLAWVKDKDRMASADWAAINPQTPEARVELFNATASAPAMRLARLMSVVPVELPVVHLLQQVFFKQAADPVHVAEVYDSCLLVPQKSPDGSETLYDFVPGVRELLNQVNTIDETLDVLDALSQEIAQTLGFSISSFTALLAPDLDWDEAKKAAILPFAQIATQVLSRLGGQYATLARKVEEDARRHDNWIQSDDAETPPPDAVLPEFITFEFVRAELIDAADRDEDAVQGRPRQVNEAGLEIIKTFEGFRPEAYQDDVGVWTIGFGHTSAMGAPEVGPGMQITEAEATTILRQDLRLYEQIVDAALTIETNDNQFAAMVSLVYNVGQQAFQESALLQKHNAGDFSGAAEEFRRWVNVDGQPLAGLQRRRDEERRLYLLSEAEATETSGDPVVMVTDTFMVATIAVVPETDDEVADDEAPDIENEENSLKRFEFVMATLRRRQDATPNEPEGASEWVIQRQQRSAYRMIECLTAVTSPASEGQRLTSPKERLQLWEDLVDIPRPQLDVINVALEVPSSVIPPFTAPAGDRIRALLQWAEGTTGPGLTVVRDALQAIMDTAPEGKTQAPSDVNLEMVSIPGGTFIMGSPPTEEERFDREGPQHEVAVQPFLMGRYPVTQAQWRLVASLEPVNRELDPDPSNFKGDNHPVEKVRWYEAVEFCDRLSRHTEKDYRLPTEAEWEYACRAGTATPFHFGETISSELANYRGTATYKHGPEGEHRQETIPVDHFGIANAFGLCDMHGNVDEWCQDHYHNSYEKAPEDGSAWLTNDESATRIRRGGSWLVNPRYCRSAYRDSNYPDDRDFFLGFRVVCFAPRTLQSETS